MQIPDELRESARVDGASEYVIWAKIMRIHCKTKYGVFSNGSIFMELEQLLRAAGIFERLEIVYHSDCTDQLY